MQFPSWLNWLRSRPALHIMLALVQVTSLLIFAAFADHYGELKANEWLSGLRAASDKELSLTVAQVGVDKSVVMSQAQRQMTNAMFKQSLIHARHHLQLVKYFYSRYYSSIATAMIAAFMAGASLLLVSRVGWANANQYLLNVLIVMSVLAVFFLTFPAVYQQKENIEANKSLYLGHVNFENELRAFLATGLDSEGKGPAVTAVYLREMNRRLAELNQLSVGFNPEKLPSSGSFRELVKVP